MSYYMTYNHWMTITVRVSVHTITQHNIYVDTVSYIKKMHARLYLVYTDHVYIYIYIYLYIYIYRYIYIYTLLSEQSHVICIHWLLHGEGLLSSWEGQKGSGYTVSIIFFLPTGMLEVIIKNMKIQRNWCDFRCLLCRSCECLECINSHSKHKVCHAQSSDPSLWSRQRVCPVFFSFPKLGTNHWTPYKEWINASLSTVTVHHVTVVLSAHSWLVITEVRCACSNHPDLHLNNASIHNRFRQLKLLESWSQQNQCSISTCCIKPFDLSTQQADTALVIFLASSLLLY